MSRTFTDEVLAADMAAVLRGKTPAERLAISAGMWQFARRMIRLNLERQRPEWSAAEVEREVARRVSHGAV